MLKNAAISWPKACVQIYTGEGKGKTTAALGLALRAAGAGLSVYIGQFIKGHECSELAGLKMLGDCVTIERFGSGKWISQNSPPAPDETERAHKGLHKSEAALTGGSYNIVILDEIFGALKAGLINRDNIFRLLELRPEKTELIMTGRNAPEDIQERADLVSEIKCIKHYYQQGLPARTGIEK